MAELMAGGALLGAFLNVVFDKLASHEVVSFIRGKNLSPLLERLEENLMVVNAVLNDAEKKQITNSHVNQWLSELKHVVYMADDLLDEVATATATTQMEVTTDLFSRFTEIVEKLDRILKLIKSLGLREIITTDSSSSRLPSTSVPDRNIYGRDEDKNAIIKLLLDDNNDNEGEEISVITIVGMGGVGKTTLAQTVYSDDSLKQGFDFKAWVCVSEEFDIIKVTKSLLEALIPEEASKLTNLNSLQEKLVEMLTGKKFLVVLDDVWILDYGHWDLLKKPFQYGLPGSKIVVTTRTKEVASLFQTAKPYNLSHLSNEHCWLVFANHACLSPELGKNPAALEKIGLEIVNKCKGLPLAAQSLGGLLRTKRDIEDWNNVLNSDIWELPKSEIIPSLIISYQYLPPHLKRCFIHCSLYPKDFEFEKDEVILLWMAEDLLPPPKKGKTLEKVGGECFDYLVSCSFLQRSSDPEKENCFGMHDLMHDLATFLGGEFYSRSSDLGDETTIGSKTRHLSFINFSSPSTENSGVLGSSKFLRTFLRTYDVYSFWNDVESQCIELSNLECLRVLSLPSFGKLIALPDSIGGMIHLRYLDLSRTRIKSLPESLCNLYNLQTLKLEYCKKLKMLPRGTQKLVNLHYLGISDTSIEEMPERMSKLNQLQYLPYFIVGKHEETKIKEVGGLSNLHGSFSIKKLENVENGSEALEARMMDKKHIQHLVLDWSSDESCMDSQTEMDILCKLEPHQDLPELEIKGYRGTRYPDWVGKPCYHNMTSITLSYCNSCFTLPSLGTLPSLRDLRISDMKKLVRIGASLYNNNDNDGSGGSLLTVPPFPSLESLEFYDMPCWEVWSCSEQPGAFPQLKRLIIKYCPELKGDLPSHLPALEELEIYNCQQLACSVPSGSSMREIRIDRANKLVFQELPLRIESLTIGASPMVMESVFGAIINKQPTCLQSLHLEDCWSACMSFPPWDCLPASLKTLEIKHCRKLEFPQQTHESLERLSIYRSCDSLTCLSLYTFPNLKSLHISECENLESISSSVSRDNVALVELKVSKCPSLVSLAREGLGAPSLTDLRVSNCDKLESLPPRMNTLLPSLIKVVIDNCPRIESFPEGGMPPSLREIHVSNCEKLLLLLSGLAWPTMDMLTRVVIEGACDGIKSLFPKEGLLPPSLKSLSLCRLSSLETLDCKGLLHLTHLQHLTINYCPKLENMAGERLPASLTALYIDGCPLLGKQCRAKNPQIWPKISHIPTIKVDSQRYFMTWDHQQGYGHRGAVRAALTPRREQQLLLPPGFN